MTHSTNKKDAAAETATPSGQTKGLDRGNCSTLAPDSQLTTLQHRIGHIRLKARTPGACIALQLLGPIAAELLTLAEAEQLRDALTDLIEDLEADARARDWSRHRVAQIIAAADASVESYRSLP